MDTSDSDYDVFCVNCREMSEFEQPPVEQKTRIGARRRLAGRCATCGSKVSRFLPSEDGPTVHGVRVGESTKRELERAAVLLEISQRAIVENVLRDRLTDFVVSELETLREGGLISRRERARREQELMTPIESRSAPEPDKSRPPANDAGPFAGFMEALRRMGRGNAQK